MGAPHSPATTDPGRKTRSRILDHAVQVASTNGFEALAFGRLAAELQMSKSGLFAHFGAKEQLQVETYEHGIALFTRHVIDPVLSVPDTQPALRALVEHWIHYIRGRVFSGGCILTAASAEFDHRPGMLREHIARSGQDWLTFIADVCRSDQHLGHLDNALDPDDVAFQIRAAFLVMNWHHQLYGEETAFDRGRRLTERIMSPP